MSILIKGMEMPTRCYTCPCADLEYYDCNLMPRTRIEQHKRLDDCPLVKIPPHGRLIDALWVRDQIIKQWMEYSDDSHMYKRGMEDAYEVIRNAPTIIPEEEGE